MCENFEQGLREGEEFQYWQKVNALKEKLALLERTSDPAINQTAQTLLDLCETWENTTQEERKDLVHVIIQEIGLDVTVKCILWVKAIRITNYCFRSWAVYGWTTKSAP